MSDPFLGEIRLFGGNFAPAGWAFPEGQLLPISENDALFTLIGTTYGGDGQETFALPDLRDRCPVHQGQGPGLTYRVLGELGGVTEVTLTTQQMALHNHALLASTNTGNEDNPANEVLATGVTVKVYSITQPGATLAANTILPTGGNQPHTNQQPYVAIKYIISLYGIFPQQN